MLISGSSNQDVEAKEIQLIVDSALIFFDNLVKCAEEEGEDVALMLAQAVIKFSTISDELDDGVRMEYGKLCVGIIVNQIVKGHRQNASMHPLNLRETLESLLSVPMEKLLHMKI
tara:strand:+ start:34 stop:378 length:345 start_codon:yes stop_codon:yes gene_type:complete